MSNLKITAGVSVLSNTGRPLKSEVFIVSEELKNKVLERDENSCQYCGFHSEKYQEVNYNYDAADSKNREDMYATACIFCKQCFELEKLGYMQSGAIIWLPEIGQAALNHICRAIYVARITQGPMADSARDILEALISRREEAKKRLGTDEPKIIASVLHDFLEAKEYRFREKKLEGFRILPLDRRIIREGELEFNQFPQILAYWRSKDGPYGGAMPRDWPEMFFKLKAKIAKNDDNSTEEHEEVEIEQEIIATK